MSSSRVGAVDPAGSGAAGGRVAPWNNCHSMLRTGHGRRWPSAAALGIDGRADLARFALKTYLTDGFKTSTDPLFVEKARVFCRLVSQSERDGQIGRRTAKGSAGSRQPECDPEIYKQRNLVERCFNRLKQFRGLATRYANRAAYYLAELTSPRSYCGCDELQDRP